MQRGADERPVGELLGDLARATGTLVRQEVQLATAEMSGKAKVVGREVALVGLGGVIAHAGLLLLVAALSLALGTIIPIWVAALVLGLAFAITGYALVQKGMTALKSVSPVPERTVQTLQEDKLWVKEELGR